MRTLENSQFSQKRRETLGLFGVPWLYGSLSNTPPKEQDAVGDSN